MLPSVLDCLSDAIISTTLRNTSLFSRQDWRIKKYIKLVTPSDVIDTTCHLEENMGKSAEHKLCVREPPPLQPPIPFMKGLPLMKVYRKRVDA